MLRILTGDLFDSDAQVLTNAVNCAGVMGKGIALEFYSGPRNLDSERGHL